MSLWGWILLIAIIVVVILLFWIIIKKSQTRSNTLVLKNVAISNGVPELHGSMQPGQGEHVLSGNYSTSPTNRGPLYTSEASVATIRPAVL